MDCPILNVLYPFEKDNSRYQPVLVEDFSPIELYGKVIIGGKGITETQLGSKI